MSNDLDPKAQQFLDELTEEKLLEAQRKMAKKGLPVPDGFTAEVLENVVGSEQLTREQILALVNNMSLRDPSPAYQAGYDCYVKIIGKGNKPRALDENELGALQFDQERALAESKKDLTQPKNKGYDPRHAGPNGFLVASHEAPEGAKPNQNDLPDLTPQGPGKGQGAA